MKHLMVTRMKVETRFKWINFSFPNHSLSQQRVGIVYLVLRIANCIIHIYLLCPQYLCDCAGLFAVCVSGVSTSNTAAVAAPAAAEIKHRQWPHCPVIDDQDSDFKPWISTIVPPRQLATLTLPYTAKPPLLQRTRKVFLHTFYQDPDEVEINKHKNSQDQDQGKGFIFTWHVMQEDSGQLPHLSHVSVGSSAVND